MAKMKMAAPSTTTTTTKTTKMSLSLSLGLVLVSCHLLSLDASTINHVLKKEVNDDSDEPRDIEFPSSSDQNFRIPHAISWGWTEDKCHEEAQKSKCKKCQCGEVRFPEPRRECMVLTEACSEIVCPLVEDLPEQVGLCCPVCPIYGDGSLRDLEEECNRREAEKAELGGELCPGICSCTKNGPFTVCDVRQVQMCERECEVKYGSDPCAHCNCDEDGSCSLIMKVQSEPFCGVGVDPIQREGECGLVCP